MQFSSSFLVTRAVGHTPHKQAVLKNCSKQKHLLHTTPSARKGSMRFKRLRGILCQLNETPSGEGEDKLNGNTTNFSITHNSLAALVLHLPLTRFVIWGSLGIIACLLQDFLGLAFGTYVLSYLGNSFVRLGTRHWPEYRRPLILAFFAGIALLVTTLFVWAIPSLVHEAADVAFRLQSEDPYVLVGAKLRQLLGDQVCGQLEVFLKMVAAASEEAPNMILVRARPLALRVDAWDSGVRYVAVGEGGILKRGKEVDNEGRDAMGAGCMGRDGRAARGAH
ncbi:hypothetical protein CYMTET_28186 [Cymbomonas tetramitiformis]|uniref:Uncharacterized protein n=1 Tax=Cymbomonas tetramitiformis TaxID=36881 RepID=A0AAE0FNH9_9CHLO|nr:hypothetical protein CYMTET_28186 [Cymbomonas tetramitiformis]